MRRRALFIGLALALLSVGAAHAQSDWPAGKTIRIIVPFPPGGTVDIVTRLLTQPLGAALNTSVIIENKPGAGTNIATEHGGARRARRADAADGRRAERHQRDALSQSEFQPAARSRRRHAGGEPAERAGGQPERAGEHARRVHRAQQGEARHDQFRLRRDRDDAASLRRDVRHDDRRAGDARAVSRLGAGEPGSRRRPGAGDVRFGRLGAAADPGRQAAPARRHRPGARSRSSPTFRPWAKAA